MRLSNMRGAFTLAEVLITLGIIGVVAAMTMPTLMNSTQGAQYKAAYKKALSALSQAVTLNVALDDWNFADVERGDDDNSTYSLSTMLRKRMNVVKAEDDTFKDAQGDDYAVRKGTGTGSGITANIDDPGQGNITLFFNDGIMFTYPTGVNNCTIGSDTQLTSTNRATLVTNNCTGFIDVNGVKAPNRIVQCDEGTGADDSNCVIKSPTDIYPVLFYDQTVLPNSVAARAVLYSK